MDIHYNAFISYRHHPEDIKVAEQIHRGLEHYRVPKAIRKNNDAKMRLFRDKEELPITSNLTDDITRALRNSDFLIVICSTHTKESIWVQREIETFLQTHDHSRVLTVLVNGEPYDTIPEILCSEERIDPVTGEKNLLPIEPLSCDWRGGKRKAYREELPRLAAALLGCGYDELRQRERQYRTRRLITVFSVALAAVIGFAGYVIYNGMQIQKANDQLELANNQLTDANIEIQKNLEEAQTNQSKFLASASSQQMESGDRMLALALAQEALPKFEGERPYVANAEYALSNAAGAYMAQDQVASIGSITCDALINLYEATDGREWMFVTDQRNVLSIWDLQTYQMFKSVKMEKGASRMLITPDDNVILYTSDFKACCYDKELNLLWEQGGINEIALSSKRDVLIAEVEDNTLAFFDAVTGQEVLDRVQILLQPEDYTNGWRITMKQELIDLEKPIILDYTKYGEPSNIVSVDIHSGVITDMGVITPEFLVRKTGYTNDGNVLVMSVHEHGSWNSNFNDMLTHSPVDVQLWCFGPAGQRLWTADMTSYSYSTETTLYQIKDTEKLFCQVDNLAAVVDTKTGNVLGVCETGANPVWVSADDTSAVIMLEDGSIGVYEYEKNEFNSTRYLKEDIVSGFGGKGYYVKQNYGAEILIYGIVLDKNWQMFEGEYNSATYHHAVWGDYVATYNYDSICIFDAREQKLLWDIEEEELSVFQLLEFTADGSQLWFSDRGDKLVGFDIQTGDRIVHNLPVQLDEDSPLHYSYNNRICMIDDVIYVQTKNLWTNEVYVIAFDIQSQQETCVKVSDVIWESYQTGCVLLTANADCAYLWSGATGTIHEVNMQTGEVKVFAENITGQPVVQFLNDGNTYMVAVDNQVTFYQTGTEPLFTLQLEEVNGISAYRIGSQILLLMDSGDIWRYTLDGQKIGEIATKLYSSYFSSIGNGFEPEEITWQETGDGDLFVNILRSGNLVDMDCWESRAWIPNCVAYIPALDQFVTTGDDWDTNAPRMGVYPRYTTQDIQKMAKDALKGYSLTQNQKDYYGIS